MTEELIEVQYQMSQQKVQTVLLFQNRDSLSHQQKAESYLKEMGWKKKGNIN